MSSLSAFLMRNKLDALGEKQEYSTADVNSLMPQKPSWSSPLAGLGSYQLSQEAGAEPNWFGRNVLSNIPPEAMHAANFLIPGKVPRIPNPIKAYHGSPHDFDKFDISKIGTGEGNQAYGHGLYFAEKEGVAKSYRDELSSPLYDGGPFRAMDGRHVAASWLDQHGGNRDAAIADLTQRVARYEKAGDTQGAHPERIAIAALRKGTEAAVTPGPGKMYEVALHATPEQFLDWDKPLSGQPASLQNAELLQRVAAARHFNMTAEEFANLAPKQQANLISKTPEGAAGDMLGSFANSGAGIHNWFSAWNKHNPGGAEGALREAGIPGIRYLDQGSRGAGTGTSNYVVWSPELIEILRKYAAPPAIAAPALASILQDQQSQ
jgi:hypothetical protein